MAGQYQSAGPFAPGSEYAHTTAYEPVPEAQQVHSSPQYLDEYGGPVHMQQDYTKPHDFSQSTVTESHTKPNYDQDHTVAGTRNQQPRDRSPSILRWWYTEILACLASILAIVIQVVVLRKFDGMPEDSWPSRTLTLNGLIAILATACRGSLMVGVASALAQSRWTRFSHASEEKPYRLKDYVILDEASRGPGGSFRVLWRFKGILHMSCLGALITIASLAMSTCSQQVLTLRQDNVISQDSNLLDQLGQVIRAENIDTIQATDPVGNFGFRRLSRAASLAIYDGFLSTSIPQFPMACPTGDCTWPVFPTLGVCGRCTDISSDLEHVNQDEGGPRDGNYYKLPSGDSVGYYGGVGGTVFSVQPLGQGRMFQGPDLEFLQAKNDTVIAQFTALGVTQGNAFDPKAALASECAIWFCVQARNISVRAGTLSDTIVDEWVQYEKRNDGESDLVSRSVFVNVPQSFGSEPGSGHEINVDSMGLRVLQTQMEEMLDGNITDASRTSDWIEGLYSSINDTEAWVDRLTESMTNNIRQAGNVPSNSRFYQASVTTKQVTIQVRWEWLAVPAVLVFLSITYLACEIIWTATSHARPWKADPMVPLFTTLDIDKDFLLAAASGLHRPKGLDDELEKVRVRLHIDEAGRSRLSGTTGGHSRQEGYQQVSPL